MNAKHDATVLFFAIFSTGSAFGQQVDCIRYIGSQTEMRIGIRLFCSGTVSDSVGTRSVFAGCVNFCQDLPPEICPECPEGYSPLNVDSDSGTGECCVTGGTVAVSPGLNLVDASSTALIECDNECVLVETHTVAGSQTGTCYDPCDYIDSVLEHGWPFAYGKAICEVEWTGPFTITGEIYAEGGFYPIDTNPTCPSCGPDPIRTDTDFDHVIFVDLQIQQGSAFDVLQSVYAVFEDGSTARLGALGDEEFDPVPQSSGWTIDNTAVALSIPSPPSGATTSTTLLTLDVFTGFDGDINDDDETCWADRQLCADGVGYELGDDGYTPRMDFELDGDIDSDDWHYFRDTFDYCLADVTCDGAVNTFDYLAYQTAYGNESLSADFTFDDVVNVFDYLAFQTEYANGC